MLKNIQFQLCLMLKKKEFLLSFSIMMLYSLGTFIIACFNYYGKDTTQIWPYFTVFSGSDYSVFARFGILIFWPLLVALPFSDSYFIDKKINILPVILTRCSKKVYFLSKAITVFLSSFLVFFIPLFLNLILCKFTFVSLIRWNPEMMPINPGGFDYMIFYGLFQKNIFIYNVFFLLLLTCFFGFVSIFIYCISFFIKKQRTIAVFWFFIFNNIFGLLVSLGFFVSLAGETVVNYDRYILAGIDSIGMNYLYFIILNGMIVLISATILGRKVIADDL